MRLSRRSLLQGSMALLPGAVTGWRPGQARAQSGGGRIVHALAMHGEPKYGPDFRHFDYANPEAPKGGNIRLAVLGDTFDSFSPYILQGTPAVGAGAAIESLMTGSSDEAFTEYGLVAETIEVPDDRSWVAFNLRPEARWHDGKPITVDDVIFSLEILRTKGDPFYRAYYANVSKAEKVGERKIRFEFGGGINRELPLIMGQLPILPKHYWEGRAFDKPTLEPPLGSGSYKIDSFEIGRSVTLRRVDDYWGKDLPVNRGSDNWETVRYDYYGDATVAIEALKAGEYDFRQENSAKNWATAYDVPAVKEGRIIKETIPNELPTGMQAFGFNARREVFRDSQVRKALAYAFDFEWSNKNLFYDQYTRTKSYFSNSELASRGLPTTEELQVLEPYSGRIPEEVFTTEYQPPQTAGDGNIRQNLREATKILKNAGWEVEDGKLVNAATGKPLKFEILLDTGSLFERIVQPFVQNLERLGVEASIRLVDSAQYEKRTEDFDFDMLVAVFGQSLSPGNEQRDFWSSEAAVVKGSRNLLGISDPVVDELIDSVISAPDRESLITRTRALDRVLLWGHYVIPHWHSTSFRVVYWNKFSRPAISPKYALGFNYWWIDSAKEAILNGSAPG